MSHLGNVIATLAEDSVRLEAYDRSGAACVGLPGRDFVRAVETCRPTLAGWRAAGEESVALVFKPEETVEFLAVAFAAFIEGLAIVPLYPNWNVETQKEYLDAYRLRSLAVGKGFASRVDSWGFPEPPRILRVDLEALLASAPAEVAAPRFEPPPERAAAWIFTSGTSGKVAKMTEITFGNLEAAIENVHKLDFLSQGMTVHNPLSASHIFSFVATLAFLTLRPRRILFSDVQHLSRLGEDRTGRIDGMILVPIVLSRMRSGFYERLSGPLDPKRALPELRQLARLPLALRRLLKRVVLRAERAVMALETRGRCGFLGHASIRLARRAFGPLFAKRLGSPRFVVVGGARPGLESMAFLEVMGIRCLQGWGMTETTGPLSVCRIGDRYRGAFGTAGTFFEGTRGSIVQGELIVEGAQVARGYREPGGAFVPFHGRWRTGDLAEFDAAGRLRIIGKASERITTANGINYNPIPIEEAFHAADLERENLLDHVVVLGEGQPSLGGVFFLRETGGDEGRLREYVEALVRAYNETRPVDERIGSWTLHPQSLRESGLLGPTGKLLRRKVDEAFAGIFEAR
jgi:long-subunit acyl-CoA synthetase (AMP-forming)